MTTTFLAIKLNSRLRPLDRGAGFEDPLQEILDERAPGSSICGGGTLINDDGEPLQCDIDLDLDGDPAAGLAIVIEALEGLGAPRGSTATLGDADPVPFGVTDGVGVYLNGTDLPDEVYANADINDFAAALNERLGDDGEMHSFWEGPSETALYLYGPSNQRMRDLIADVVAEHPLAQQCRIVDLTGAASA